MKTALLAAILTLAAAVAAQAQPAITAPQVAKACSSKEANQISLCDGFIAGAADQVLVTPEAKNAFCRPAGVKLSALREAVVAFAKTHPDAVKGYGIELVNATLKANYPCPAK